MSFRKASELHFKTDNVTDMRIHRLSGLRESTEYHVRVAAVTGAGRGAAVQITARTTTGSYIHRSLGRCRSGDRSVGRTVSRSASLGVNGSIGVARSLGRSESAGRSVGVWRSVSLPLGRSVSVVGLSVSVVGRCRRVRLSVSVVGRSVSVVGLSVSVVGLSVSVVGRLVGEFVSLSVCLYLTSANLIYYDSMSRGGIIGATKPGRLYVGGIHGPESGTPQSTHHALSPCSVSYTQKVPQIQRRQWAELGRT